jgi:hypothetical protein
MAPNHREPGVATAIGASILVAGIAFAYWAATATAAGTLTTAAANQVFEALTVTQDAYAGSALAPGAPEHDISGTITNPNRFPVRVSALGAMVAVDADHAAAGCLASWYAVSGLSTAPSVPATSTTTAFSAKIQFVNATANQDACKTATVTVSYLLTSS